MKISSSYPPSSIFVYCPELFVTGFNGILPHFEIEGFQTGQIECTILAPMESVTLILKRGSLNENAHGPH
jgi:hypothetical protein